MGFLFGRFRILRRIIFSLVFPPPVRPSSSSPSSSQVCEFCDPLRFLERRRGGFDVLLLVVVITALVLHFMFSRGDGVLLVWFVGQNVSPQTQASPRMPGLPSGGGVEVQVGAFTSVFHMVVNNVLVLSLSSFNRDFGWGGCMQLSAHRCACSPLPATEEVSGRPRPSYLFLY